MVMKEFIEINENELLNTNEIMHDYEFYYKLFVLNEQLDFTTKAYAIVE
jgi:hypothetical protein